MVRSFTAQDVAAETQQFADLTSYLLPTYMGTGLTFVLEQWEGDWAARCGSYNKGNHQNHRLSQVWAAGCRPGSIWWRERGGELGRRLFCPTKLPAAIDWSMTA